MRRSLIVPTALAVVLAACGDTSGTTTSSAASQTTTPAATTSTSTTVPAPATSEATTTTTSTTASVTTLPPAPEAFRVYYFLDSPSEPDGPFLAPVHRSTTDVGVTEAIEADAIVELTRGPLFAETDVGVSTAVPEGTRLRGLAIEGGMATVDLSEEFEMGGGTLAVTGRLAQVVYTLTQFDTIDAVRFKVEGVPVEVFSAEGVLVEGPVGRSDFLYLQPEILVETPALGAAVELPLTVGGVARAFEGNVRYAFMNWDGLILVDSFTTACCNDIGEFSPFEFVVDVDLPSGARATLIVWEDSARDGSQINVVEYPLIIE